ncbi:MAG: hypothetical protein AB9860_03120 [Methanomassiliicoccales archaeon]
MDLLAGLSVFLGALAALLLLTMRVFRQRWARMFADAGREKGRPPWAWISIALSIAGIVLFWYLHFVGYADLSLAMAALGTFLLGRTAQSLIAKGGLRNNVQLIVQGKIGPAFLPYTVSSIALVVLGLL